MARALELSLDSEIRFPHSIGMLYSALTYYLGFKVNDGEYKVMGLAPYGEPVYADRIYDRLIDLKDDGSFRLDMRYFNYCTGLTMTNDRFADIFDGVPNGVIPMHRLNSAIWISPARYRPSPKKLCCGSQKHCSRRPESETW